MMRFRKTAVVLGAVLAVSAGLAGSASGGPIPRTSYEATALAVPTAAAPSDIVQVRHVDMAMARHVHVSAAANAAIDCDQCTGRATSLQVLFAGTARSLVARNVAAAWTDQCTGCSGSAVALQVIVAASAKSVKADNRAFAVNAACAGCQVSAVALQFVVVDRHAHHISRRAMTRIYTLAARLLAQLTANATGTGSAPAAQPQATPRTEAAPAAPSAGPAVQDPAGSTGRQVAGILRADLHAPVHTSVRVSGG